jgi:hypothetical protein
MFAASDRRLFAFIDIAVRGKAASGAQRLLAIVVFVVGVFGQLHDSWANPTQSSGFNVHALFGFLLCGSIVVRFFGRLAGFASPAPLSPQEVGALTRRLTRLVYLLLYSLLGAKEIVGIVKSLRQGGAIMHLEDFQIYLAYGLLALIIIRICGATETYAGLRRARDR